jgi:hypothetical protein
MRTSTLVMKFVFDDSTRGREGPGTIVEGRSDSLIHLLLSLNRMLRRQGMLRAAMASALFFSLCLESTSISAQTLDPPSYATSVFIGGNARFSLLTTRGGRREERRHAVHSAAVGTRPALFGCENDPRDPGQLFDSLNRSGGSQPCDRTGPASSASFSSAVLS